MNFKRKKIHFQYPQQVLCTFVRSLQLEHTSLQGELAEARDQYQSIEVERAKLEHKCEVRNSLDGKGRAVSHFTVDPCLGIQVK